jgi:hypothetical protein
MCAFLSLNFLKEKGEIVKAVCSFRFSMMPLAWEDAPPSLGMTKIFQGIITYASTNKKSASGAILSPDFLSSRNAPLNGGSFCPETSCDPIFRPKRLCFFSLSNFFQKVLT